MRYDNRFEIGKEGAIYEFRVKGRRVEATMTDEEWEIETRIAVDSFSDELRKRYKWIGKIYLTGRSNGWLAVEDKRGEGHISRRMNHLKIIEQMVESRYRQFCKAMEEEYPRVETEVP